MNEQNAAGRSRRDFIRNATAVAVGTAAAARFQGLVAPTRLAAATRFASPSSAAAAAAPAPPSTPCAAIRQPPDRDVRPVPRPAEPIEARPDRAARPAVPRHRRPPLHRLRRLQAAHGKRRQSRPPAPRRPLPADAFEACIDAGKHVFCEKPVAVDAPGVRSVLKTSEEAKAKNLAIVSGLCWRYDLGVRETIKRIPDGAIGDIIAIQENYLTGTLWHRGRKHEWSEMEYQIRNWLYYTWLSGDHIVEQHIHSLDKAMWLMGDTPPAAAYGMGGRQVRTEPQFGNIYDHHAVVYDVPGRHLRDHDAPAAERVRQKGRQRVHRYHRHRLRPAGLHHQGPDAGERRAGAQRHGTSRNTPTSSPASAPASRSTSSCRWPSSLTAIMGRMTASGKTLTWDQALNSPELLMPATPRPGGR